jgi:ribosomal protein S18 acetylase RimI-like enzyme
MDVRNARTADVDALLALNAFVQQQHADALPRLFKIPTKSRQAKQAFSDFVSDADSLVLLAEETKPAGYLFAQFQNRPASPMRFKLRLLYVHHMVVAPKFRRQGVATLLLSAAFDAARDRGIQRIELDVWSFNSDAKKIYAKHGFKVFNEKMATDIDET